MVSAPAGPVLGFVSVGPSRDEVAPPGDGEVYALYVHPDTWGTGVGSRLLTTAAEPCVRACVQAPPPFDPAARTSG